jgi:hypothetical protein
MNMEELDKYLVESPYVSWSRDDEGNFYFRHDDYDKEEEKLKVEPSALAKLTPAELDRALVNGRNVDHITRITGYFSKVSGWNKGKKGELTDRHRVEIQ